MWYDFYDLLLSIIPLYLIIFLGLIVGRYTDISVSSIANIMLYSILPIVMFGVTAQMEFSIEYFVPPLVIAFISIFASLIAYNISAIVWGSVDKRKNLMGLLGVSSNATYFGVPIATVISGKDSLGLYMMMVLSLFILDATLSYYYAVRGDFSVRESLKKLAKLPIIYGVIGGIIFNILGFKLNQLVIQYWDYFVGAMIILGMIMIGAALSRVERIRFDWQFFSGVILLRFILWPLLGMACIIADFAYFNTLTETIYSFIIIICTCPLAANTVAYTAKLNLFPALTACMVLISTAISFILIPSIFWLQKVVF